ncbi:hypothetical protein MBLNU459_g3368t2 [Dothideomycetes sp. NU459]
MALALALALTVAMIFGRADKPLIVLEHRCTTSHDASETRNLSHILSRSHPTPLILALALALALHLHPPPPMQTPTFHPSHATAQHQSRPHPTPAPGLQSTQPAGPDLQQLRHENMSPAQEEQIPSSNAPFSTQYASFPPHPTVAPESVDAHASGDADALRPAPSSPSPPPPPSTTQADQAWEQVFSTIRPARSDDSFSDSGYEDSVHSHFLSSSASLSSSVRDFDFENGRRYHAFRQGAYLLPNDDAEQEREDMKHATILTVCGEKLHFAPIPEENPGSVRVLDMGTGTGIWCVEMGDLHPSAEIVGVDLSPIQPDWVPPNVRFIVDDIESEWLYPENHFDMIHSRHMAIAIKDWDHILSSAYTHLKPGGWLEFQELDNRPTCDDGTMTADNGHLRWTHLVADGLSRAGVNLHGALEVRARMEAAGFKNITEQVLKVPIGPWPANRLLKKVGMYMHAVIYDGLQGIAMGPLTRALGWTKEEVEVFLPSVRKDLNDPSIHTQYNLHVIYGQKI